LRLRVTVRAWRNSSAVKSAGKTEDGLLGVIRDAACSEAAS
jgi:hypothetical protein